MKKINYLALGVTFLAAQSSTLANCPTLDEKNLAFYLAPKLGSGNPLPQGNTAMVYTRTSAADVRGTLAKGLFGKGKTYNGVESNPTTGKVVCDYTKLSEDWKSASGLNNFKLISTVKKPTSFIGSRCPTLTFDELTNLMTGDEVQLRGGPWWKIHTSGTLGTIEHFGKGLGAKIGGLFKDKPKGTIDGVPNTQESVPFSHTCTYTYHATGILSKSTETLVLSGKMNLALLAATH